jgi:hypothetical protein
MCSLQRVQRTITRTPLKDSRPRRWLCWAATVPPAGARPNRELVAHRFPHGGRWATGTGGWGLGLFSDPAHLHHARTTRRDAPLRARGHHARFGAKTSHRGGICTGRGVVSRDGLGSVNRLLHRVEKNVSNAEKKWNHYSFRRCFCFAEPAENGRTADRESYGRLQDAQIFSAAEETAGNPTEPVVLVLVRVSGPLPTQSDGVDTDIFRHQPSHSSANTNNCQYQPGADG